MLNTVSALFAWVLVVIGVFMTGWGGLGIIEYLFGIVILIPLQNPAFPNGVQFLHWLAILGSGVVFLAGYVTQWRHTPQAMVVIYAVMAALCFVETIDFLTHPGRYAAMVAEYVAYLAICLYLLRSARMKAHFRTNG